MKFTLRIESRNAALGAPSAHLEISRLLVIASEHVLDGYMEGTSVDHNGNTVGSWTFEPEGDDE